MSNPHITKPQKVPVKIQITQDQGMFTLVLGNSTTPSPLPWKRNSGEKNYSYRKMPPIKISPGTHPPFPPPCRKIKSPWKKEGKIQPNILSCFTWWHGKFPLDYWSKDQLKQQSLCLNKSLSNCLRQVWKCWFQYDRELRHEGVEPFNMKVLVQTFRRLRVTNFCFGSVPFKRQNMSLKSFSWIR